MKNKQYSNIGETVFSDTLDNGLAVYVVKKAGYAKKYAYFATNYGGADRRFKYKGNWIDTPMGVAHFLEHKMFDMPEGNALNMLSVLGASPNAYTSHDITAYHFECVDNFVDNLRVLLRFVSTPYFTNESVEKEQGIIGQEIGMNLDNPNSEVYYGLLRCLYENNPIREMIVGTTQSISEITPDTLYACHNVFYNPSNMVLCVVGDVDIDDVVKTASEIVTAPAGEVPVRDYGTERDGMPFDKRTEKNMHVASPIFFAGSKVDIPDSGEEHLKRIVLGQLSMKLLLGESSPLYTRLYSEGLIMQDFGAEFDVMANTAYTVFGGESRNVDAVLNEIFIEAERVGKHGFSDEYFRRVKLASIGEELRGLNRFDDICYNTAKGHFKNYDPFTTIGLIDEIKPEDVCGFVSNYLTEEKSAVSVINPTENRAR